MNSSSTQRSKTRRWTIHKRGPQQDSGKVNDSVHCWYISASTALGVENKAAIRLAGPGNSRYLRGGSTEAYRKVGFSPVLTSQMTGSLVNNLGWQ